MIGRQLRIQRALTSMAARNLRRSKVRTTLAVLGIVIGVVAISSIGAIGIAYESAYMDQLSGITTSAIVTPGADAESHYLTDRDVRLIEQYADDGTVYPIETMTARVQTIEDIQRVTIYGFDNPDRVLTAADGSIPAVWRSGAIVGSDLADDLGVSAGDTVRIGQERVRVRAVLEPAPGRASLLISNDRLYLPPRSIPTDGYSQIVIKEDSVADINATAQTLRESLNVREKRYQIQDFVQYQKQFEKGMQQIQTFLTAIGGISLLVAALSILNVMLMSVMERRTEIGVLRAVGYHRGDVLRLILSEAMLMGVIGTIGGVTLTIGVTMLINQLLLGDALAYSIDMVTQIGIGALFGVVASAISGLYPAWKAANEHPVDALRS